MLPLHLLFSAHFRRLLWPLVIAYSVLLALAALWCVACTCCLVPRRLRSFIGLICCVALFVALALTAYSVATVEVEARDLQFFQ
jgi:hypothetical protein